MRTFWLFCIYVAVTICWIEIQAVSNAIDRNTAALTNHAPVVVTNTVYVTNECTRQHWPEPGQSMPLPMIQNPWPTNFTVPGFSSKSYDERAVVYSNVTYVVHVTYSGAESFPAVMGPGGQVAHYEAVFTVQLNGQQVGKPMRGQYTGWKCFEDSPPEKWVIEALAVTNAVEK